MILVDIYVPSLDRTYDFQLNERVAINTVIEEISDMIGQKEHSKINGKVSELLLCEYKTQSPLKKALSLEQSGIKNGDKLILI